MEGERQEIGKSPQRDISVGEVGSPHKEGTRGTPRGGAIQTLRILLRSVNEGRRWGFNHQATQLPTVPPHGVQTGVAPSQQKHWAINRSLQNSLWSFARALVVMIVESHSPLAVDEHRPEAVR